MNKCAATVADVREMVIGMRAKGMQWSIFDPIVAAAIPLAKEEGGHLFEAKVTIAEAIKRSRMSRGVHVLSVPRPLKQKRTPPLWWSARSSTAYTLARLHASDGDGRQRTSETGLDDI